MPIVDSGGMKISFPDGMSLEEIQDVVSTYANAAIDVGSTITSGAIAEPIAGLTALATNDPDAVEGMTSRMTYQPRTEAGRKALNAIGQGFQSAASAIGLDQMPGYWRDRVVPALQDTAGTTAGSALAAGSLAALVAMMNMGGVKGSPAGFGRSQAGRLGSESPLARDYPKPGRPVVQVDKKTGKEFKGKGLSKKELALQKQREAINAEIIKPGIYEEYFPLSERYYADPSYYDLPGNTLTDTLAKTPEKRAEKVALFDTPDARSSLNRAYDEAANDLSRDWYATGQLQDKFIDILGPDEGSKMYKERFADAMAATTGGASPGANLAMAAYGNFLRGKGKSPPTNAYNMPHPIGGRYVSGNMKIYDKLINEGVGLTPGDYPKRHNFSANFLGDVDRATIDEQMTLGMYDGKYKAPPNLTYGVIENVVADEAAKRGLSSANMQDVAWAGFKGRAEAEKRGIEPGTEEYTQILQSQGKPMMQWFNEMIERTARVTGKSQDEVLEGFVRANMPMYGAGGLAAGLGAMQSEENPGAL